MLARTTDACVGRRYAGTLLAYAADACALRRPRAWCPRVTRVHDSLTRPLRSHRAALLAPAPRGRLRAYAHPRQISHARSCIPRAPTHPNPTSAMRQRGPRALALEAAMPTPWPCQQVHALAVPARCVWLMAWSQQRTGMTTSRGWWHLLTSACRVCSRAYRRTSIKFAGMAGQACDAVRLLIKCGGNPVYVEKVSAPARLSWCG